jgi:hypothetical protein
MFIIRACRLPEKDFGVQHSLVAKNSGVRVPSKLKAESSRLKEKP